MQVVRSTDWYFCIKNQELIYFDGNVVVLQTRLARCLEALIMNAGETISYDELLLKVWKTEHRDSSTISSVIAELRKLINCRKQGPTYIKTVPKKGYCFVGQAEIIELSPQEIISLKNSHKHNVPDVNTPDKASSITDRVTKDIVSESPTSIGRQAGDNLQTDSFRSSARKKWWWAATLLVILTAVLLSIYFAIQTKQSESTPEAFYDGLHIYTYEPGLELEFDVSLSNEWMVYTHQLSLAEPKTIILKNLVSNKSYKLNTAPGISTYSASFSPDSSKLVYIKSTEEECQVRTIEINTSGFINHTDKYISSCGLSRIWTTTAFSADGKTIFFSRSHSLADPLKIIKLNLETGFERQISSPASSGRGDYSFSLSPDGEKLAVVRNHLWQSTNIMVLDLQSEEISHVQSLPYLILGVGWKNENTLLYVDFEKRLVAYNLSENKEAKPISDRRSLNYPVVRNSRIYASRGDILDSTVWRFTISEDPAIKPVSFIDTPYKDQAPVASDNGVYFVSNRTGQNQIWLQGESGLTQISNFVESALLENILLATKHNSIFGLSNHRLFKFNIDDKDMTYLSGDNHNIKNVTLSSDENFLLYALEKDELWSIYRYDIVSEVHEFLFRGFSVRSVDNQLYFTKLRETGLWKYDLETNTEELVSNLEGIRALQDWHVSQDLLVFLGDRSIHLYSFRNEREIWKIDLKNRSKNLSCSESANICYFEVLSSGNTEIIELRKIEEL
ncbi:winged helix-turn-helix domain-containing protein [Alteromonas sp. ASW11-130]|uniref:winged helix-turn-helix domain-containing protein n=1 Tax=Alteromonas sp. ASW11-130 TaxID=3015775 RepID=UPI0022428E61|nr:winged helix-turn-helix domain-containing protein [Alteromonas sp. ASW11-130]MCW8091154.1 winged helix-turn-helix domain-containing protein [Alteromonas sp. ASW11-130]